MLKINFFDYWFEFLKEIEIMFFFNISHFIVMFIMMMIIKYLQFKDTLNYSWVSRRQQYILYLDTHTFPEQICHLWPLPSFWFAISKSNLFSFSDQRWLHKQLIFLDCCLQWISQKKNNIEVVSFLWRISYALFFTP